MVRLSLYLSTQLVNGSHYLRMQHMQMQHYLELLVKHIDWMSKARTIGNKTNVGGNCHPCFLYKMSGQNPSDTVVKIRCTQRSKTPVISNNYDDGDYVVLNDD